MLRRRGQDGFNAYSGPVKLAQIEVPPVRAVIDDGKGGYFEKLEKS